MPRSLALFVSLACLLLAPAYARAGGHSVKVDGSLAVAADQLTADGGASTPLHVLVYGSGLPDVNAALGISARDDLDVLGAESVTVPASAVDDLAAQDGVSYLQLDRPVVPTDDGTSAAPATAAAALATLFPGVDGAPAEWADGVTGAGVGIAIVDSGVTPRADFGSRLVQVKLPTQDGTKLDDGVGHGSFVAGVAAGASPNGKYVGIAPGATVYAVDVARADGVYTSDVVAGLRWVLLHAKQANIRVVNLSLAETSPSQYTASSLDAAVEQLWKAGVVVVVSSGNLGPDSMLYAPGNDPFAITVGASDPADTAGTADDTLAPWSSYGTTQSGALKPELVAPGRHIVSTISAGSALAQQAPAANVVENGSDGEYLRMNGTSFSAPQVAGAVALLLQQQPSLTPDEVKWILASSARPLAGSTAGALDLGAAEGLLAAPHSANQGIPYSGWAQPGDATAIFLGAVSATARAQAFEKEAAVWTRQAKAFATRAGEPGLRTIQARTLCASSAAAWERAAGAWDDAAQAWNAAAAPVAASTAAQNAAAAWKSAGDEWSAALQPTRASVAWEQASVDLDRSAAWEHSVGWEKSVGWESAAWERSVGWEFAGIWD